MKLEQSFEVEAPVEQVWTALIDLEKVAPCLPGAAITGHDDDGTYHGEFKVKLGPTTASYRGTIKIQSADAETHTATLAARGNDKRGQGGASATIVNALHATDAGGTRVDAATDFTITGRLARFGRGGMIKDISNRLLRDFAACLQQRLAAEPAGALTGDEAAASAGAAAAADPDAPAEAAPSTPPPPAASRRRPPQRRSRSTASRCSSRSWWSGSSACSSDRRDRDLHRRDHRLDRRRDRRGGDGRRDLELRAGVSRSAAGGEVEGAPVFASVGEALDGVDVLIDYTSHHVARDNALAALAAGVAVVIGTSGLTAEDFAAIDAAARGAGSARSRRATSRSPRR